jgi:hypothetical protein
VKQCSKCGISKAETDFWKRKDKLRSECKLCEKDRIYKWRSENREYRNALEVRMNAKYPDKQRKHMLKKLYGLTLDDYFLILENQNGVCKICLEPPAENKVLHIDHDHNCCPGQKSCGQCLRGLLCIKCNRMLGLAGDSILNLLAAVDYLENSKL